MMKKNTAILLLFILTVHPVSLQAYAEEIMIPAEQVWESAKEVLKTPGFRKLDWDKKFMETKWTYDEVSRSRGIMKKLTSAWYERRYRMKIQFTELMGGATAVKITGVFQERPRDAGVNVGWSTYKLQSQDYDMERDVFFKILYALEKKKREPSKPLPRA